jgi:TIGR00730 family protein
MAARGVGLVYGGTSIGLMGVLADSVLGAGGEVIGVIPRHLVDREIAHTGLTTLRIVETMHERKALMAQLGDGFVALPGGAGTLDELFEAWTWAMLGLHSKPCALLNVDGYFDTLLSHIRHMVQEGFLRDNYARILEADDDPDALLTRLVSQRRPPEKSALDTLA